MAVPKSVVCMVVKLELEVKGEYSMWDCIPMVEVITFAPVTHFAGMINMSCNMSQSVLYIIYLAIVVYLTVFVPHLLYTGIF